MNRTLLVSLVVVLTCLVIDSEAQWWGGYYRPYYGGWGGYFGGYRPYYGRWGGYRPWRYFRSTDTKAVGEGVRAECAFYGSESVLSCRGPTTVVECEVVANFTVFPEKWDYFGIAFCPMMNYQVAPIESQVFNLYPRTTEWLNHTINIGDETYGIGLYYTSIEGLYGFKFNDVECFRDMGRLFASSTWSNEISLGTGSVDIFGEINVVE